MLPDKYLFRKPRNVTCRAQITERMVIEMDCRFKGRDRIAQFSSFFLSRDRFQISVSVGVLEGRRVAQLL